MKKQSSKKSGAGIFGRLLVVFLLVLANAATQAQSPDYNPDKLFRGVQFTVDFKWNRFFDIPYHHDSGFRHEMVTKGSFGYEVGFHGLYHINKNWSVGLGIMNGSKRNLNYQVLITEPGVFEPYASDPDLKRSLEISWGRIGWLPTRMTANWSVPIYGAYHQYIRKNPRHRLDYKLGLAVRYHIPVILEDYGTSILYDDMEYGEFTYLEIWWHYDRKALFDIQPHFGYTYVLNNHKAVSFGLSANLAFAKDRAVNSQIILEGTEFEEIGHYKMSNHYVAVDFAYVFTTPEKSQLKRDARREKRRNRYR